MSRNPNDELKTETRPEESVKQNSNTNGSAAADSADPIPVEDAEASASTNDASDNTLNDKDGQAVDQALLSALEKIQILEEQALREKAETQNIRKRVQRDVENARKFALEKMVGELLPVIDNLERSLEVTGGSGPVHEGIELTLKSFLDVLSKFKVEPIDPLGEPFDANFHQAMTIVANPDMEPNTVMDVMQKGYMLNERLVRPAMVVVSKAP